MLRLSQKQRVCFLQKVVGQRAGLNVGPVIDELANGNFRSKLRHSPEVVAMPVSRDQMIDSLKSGIFHGSDDTARITGSRSSAGVAGIDEQRFTRRGDEKRRVAAFDIDDVDVKCLRRAERGDSDEEKNQY